MKSKTLWSLNIIHNYQPGRTKGKKYQNNVWITVSLINQYNYTEYKSSIKKKKRGKKSSMKKRNCQLYFVIFGESSKPEISLCPSNILSFWCLIFYHNTLQLGKSLVSSTLLPCTCVNCCHVDWILVSLPNAIILEWHISYMKALQKPIMSALCFLFLKISCKILLFFPDVYFTKIFLYNHTNTKALKR